jgi:hypothetical protein
MRSDDSDDFPADQEELLLWDLEQAFFLPDDVHGEDPVRDHWMRDAVCIVFRISLADQALSVAGELNAEAGRCHGPSILCAGGVP